MSLSEDQKGASGSQTIKVKLIKSMSGRLKSHQACVRGLGLRKIGQTAELARTDSIMGMVHKVRYLLEVQ